MPKPIESYEIAPGLFVVPSGNDLVVNTEGSTIFLPKQACLELLVYIIEHYGVDVLVQFIQHRDEYQTPPEDCL